jgi:hypothetical protein
MSFVGSKSGGYSSTSTQSISLTNLLGIGGTSLTVKQGDLVIVSVSHSMATTASRTLAQLTPLDPSAASYSSPLGSSVQSNDSNAVSLGLFYKFMGSTPDTTVTLPVCAASTNSIAYTIAIWRGVDQTTPFAGVTVTTASGANTGLADPPSVTTPTTPKDCVVGGAFGAAVASASVFTNSGATPYDTATNLFSSGVQNTATNRAVSGMGFKRGMAVSTAFNAAITGSTTTNTGSWAAVAFVLKPDTSLSAASTLTDDFSSDNLVAGTPDGFNQNAACTATVTGGELVIQPDNATVGYNGRYSSAYYSLRGQSIYAALTQAPSGVSNPGFSDTFFGFASDDRGNIGIGVYTNGSGAMTLRRGPNGADLATGTTYNSTNHFFFRITHNDANDHLLLDGAPNSSGSPGTWTNIYDVARPVDVDVDCGQIAFIGGNFGGGSTPGAIKWDGLNTALSAGTSVALSGQSVSGAIGSLLAATALALSGGALTSSQGTVQQGAPLTGQSVAAAKGTASGAISVALTGQSLSVAQGNVALAGPTLTGQSGTVAQGSTVPVTSVSLTGQALSVTRGTVAPTSAPSLSGQALASAQGSVLQGAPITGQGAAVAQGSAAPIVSVGLTGQSVSGSSGSVSPASSPTLSGQGLTAAAGSLVAARSFGLSGQSLAGAQGSVLASSTLALLGGSLTASQGIVTVAGSSNVTAALTGQALSIAQGLLTSSSSVGVTGQQATAARGSVIAAPSVGLSGSATQSAQGSISASRSVALAGQSLTSGQGRATFSPTLTGQVAVVSLGTLLPSISPALVGQALTIAQNDLVTRPAVTYPLAGVSQPYPGVPQTYDALPAQPYPIDTAQTYPLEGKSQNYPL